MKTITAILLLSVSAWGAACTASVAGNWSAAATWGGACAGSGVNGTPALGDTATINVAVTQDVANLIVGVNGAAPVTSYLATLGGVGGGTGYTTCSTSISGGTALRAGGVGCSVVNGVVTPYLYDRGVYSACPTAVTITASGGSGAVTTGTPTCATGGGTAAIKIGSGGSLTVAATTYVRGSLTIDSAYNNVTTGLTINPGVTLYMDMTQAAGAMYRIENLTNWDRKIVADCTTSQCSLQGLGGVTSIDQQSAYVFVVQFKNVLFKNVGDGNTVAMLASSYGTSLPLDVENNTFDTCGPVFTGSSTSTSQVVFNGNVFQNTPQRYRGDPRTTNLFFNWTSSPATATRELKNNVFDGQVGKPDGNTISLTSYTVTGNVFGGGVYPQALNPVAFSDNFMRYHLASPFANGAPSVLLTVPFNGVYYLLDAAYGPNPHFFSGQGSLGLNITNFVGEFNGRDSGDSGEWISEGNGVTNGVFLCDETGVGPYSVFSTFGVNGNSLTHVTKCHGYGTFGNIDINETSTSLTGSTSMKSTITYETAFGSGTSLKMMTVGTGATINGATNANPVVFATSASIATIVPTGSTVQGTISGQTGAWAAINGTWTLTQVDSTHFSIPLDSTTFGAWSGTRAVVVKGVDVCGTGGSQCDYNAGYSAKLGGALAATQASCTDCGNQGRSYGGAWTVTPGAHDLDGQNPMFADSTRKVENWDIKYLGKPVSPAWSSGTAYNYGDLVSNSDANVFQGEAFNFRCTNTAGCSGAPGPGSYDTTWRQNWEWAGIYWLRTTAASKTVYSDGAIGCNQCSAVQALNNWVRAGFVSQNPLYWGAGHDGKDIGAVSVPTVRRLPAGALVP